MVRFVVAPGRRLVLDLEERMPGRGIWLSAERDVIETAGASPRLVRAAGGPVAVPADLVKRVEAGLVQRLVELLRAARRAGRGAGQEEARAWLAWERVELRLESDGGRVAGSGLGQGAGGPVLGSVPSAVLDAAFGIAGLGSLVLRRGPLAEAVRVAAGRLEAVRYGVAQRARGQAVA